MVLIVIEVSKLSVSLSFWIKKNEIKIIIIKRYNIIEELNKIIQSSIVMIELIRKDKIRIILKMRQY